MKYQTIGVKTNRNVPSNQRWINESWRELIMLIVIEILRWPRTHG